MVLALHSSVRMKPIKRTLAIAALLLATAWPAAAQISIGIHIGPPPQPRAYRVPPRPGGDYEWVEGYWYPQGKRYLWHDGYWTRPPYAGAFWIAPYYSGGQYFAGHWEGNHGVVGHDHRWDRSPQRDERRYKDRDDRDHHDDHR